MLFKNLKITLILTFCIFCLIISGCKAENTGIVLDKSLTFTPPLSERLIGRTSSTGTLTNPADIVPKDWSTEKFERIYENEYIDVSFREDRDVFRIEDKRTGYVWSSGINAGMREEVMMNQIFTSYANSLITFEYFDSSGVLIKQSSTLVTDDGKGEDYSVLENLSENEFILKADTGPDGFEIEVKITFEEYKMHVSIDPGTIVEKSSNKALAAIYVAPFFGAVGGRVNVIDDETGERIIEEKMPGYDGYIFVPDGSGALIRFVENSASLSPYRQRVFGDDPANSYSGTTVETNRTGNQISHIPVYGIVHGNNQAALMAYATEGSEYMEIFSSPRGNTTLYYYVTNRFIFRNLYFQSLNQQNEGFERFQPQRFDYPISLTYEFLADEQANYVGMAKSYRQSLEDRKILPSGIKSDSPKIRVDFLMADVKNAVLGTETVLMTNGSHLETIAKDLSESGVKSFDFGIYGYQPGGRHGQYPGRVLLSPKIADHDTLLKVKEYLSEIGGVLSFGQDYSMFTSKMADIRRSAAVHVSSRYIELLFPFSKPVYDRYQFTRPGVMTGWFENQAEALNTMGFDSITMDGMGVKLTGDYSERITTTRTDTINLIRTSLQKSPDGMQIAAKQANEYIFPFISAITDIPMFHSQYLIQTDTVPFIQIVLSGTVEMYSPYVNFSFYSKTDILRMIDYGVYPAFLITAKSSHLLSKTNSNDLYATSYSNQRAMINVISDIVTGALTSVHGENITDRNVLAPDVVLVSYSNGNQILINYSNNTFRYSSYVIEPQNYLLIGE